MEPTAAGLRTVAAGDLLDRLAQRPAVLLGERHDSAAHHRWQLATLQALHKRSPSLSLGLEMVPRRFQPVLDRWVAGALEERAFLAALDWSAIWGYDAELYLPILRFARDRRVPLLALNVERRLVRRVQAEGFAAVPTAEREGVGRPAPPSQAYRLQLHRLWQHHPFVPSSGQRQPSLEDLSFGRFVESQLLWDRAMAEAIADRRRRQPRSLVVALIGNGHLAGGHGVPHQLRDLGVAEASWLLPWDGGLDCAVLQPGLATAVFGVVSPPPAGLKLGVYLETHGGRVEIHQVAPGSLAERSGLRVGDRITTIDGQPVSSARQVIERLGAHPTGRTLGLRILRGGRSLAMQLALPGP